MKRLITYIFIVTFFSACGPKMNVEWKKENFTEKKFSKMAIIAISKDLEVRREIESHISGNLSKYGVQSIKGTTFLPPSATEEDWKAENIAVKLRDLGVDGVITVGVVDVREKTQYNQGDVATYPTGYIRVGRYIYRTYQTISMPGYYTNALEYIVESNLYEVNAPNVKEAMLWSGQSKVYNPSSVTSGSKSYAKNLVDYLFKNEILLAD